MTALAKTLGGSLTGVEVDVRNLTKTYGSVMPALDDQSLHIQAGEFVALLGPSGCGKTTLLRSIAGLETPDGGQIRIGDQTVYSQTESIELSPGRRGVGMMFQSYALWPHMTVRDNVSFGLKEQGLSKAQARERADSVLTDMGLENMASRYPSELSGGQQQRVALARVLAARPRVFLMDEPLSNLDARLRMDMRSEIKRLHYETGSTFVYVTHEQNEALTLATKVVVMRSGRIQQAESPNEVYARPANLFVAEFVAIPQINLLHAELESTVDGTMHWRSEAFDFPAPADAPREVTVAVRPEDIAVFEQPHRGAQEFKVYAVLSAGPEHIVQATRGKETIAARTFTRPNLVPDQPVWLMPDPAKESNVYARSTGERVAFDNRIFA
jgi:multiple sugar transport system ATP-binding protein